MTSPLIPALVLTWFQMNSKVNLDVQTTCLYQSQDLEPGSSNQSTTLSGISEGMFAALTLLAAAGFTQATPPKPVIRNQDPVAAMKGDLTLDDLFPRKSYFGKAARGMAWSFDDRYLAYIWNPYDDKGFDLYVYDSESGKSTRVTSMDVMERFDRGIKAARERYKKDDEEEKRMLAMNDMDYREWVQTKRKENETRKEPLPGYPGISEVAWAKKSNELIFGYKGDLFRWKPGGSISQLTKTRDSESSVEWLPDDSGFYAFKDQGLMRLKFDSGMLQQLDPELPEKFQLATYAISPNGRWLMLRAARNTAPYRQVDYITYRNRFAEARRTSQYWGFADDKVNEEAVMWLYDLEDDPIAHPTNDGKPWEVWRWKSGEDILDVAYNEHPWSADSSKFTYAASKRSDRSVEVRVIDLLARSQKTIYTTKADGEPSTPDFVNPFFTPDGQNIIAMFETTGFRHAWKIDPITQGAAPITIGDFEAYPLRVTPDGKSLLVASEKDSMAQLNLYKVNMQDQSWTKLTSTNGTYSMPVLSESTKKAAMSLNGWDTRPELVIQGTEKPEKATTLTQSHREGWDKVLKLKPQLFDYKNRHGQTIHGFMFLPKDLKKGQKRPLLVYVYGGPLASPMAKTVNDGNFGSSEFRFNMLLAENLGYITVAIDPRGQTGLGGAFGKANFGQPGKAQVEDLVDGVHFLDDKYGVDPNRVGVYGWSFGGFQTMMCMFTAPETFTLGMAGAGPTEWQNYNAGYTELVIGEAREGKPEDIDKFSLTHLAKNLQGNLLLLHGMEDTNVLFQHTVAVYRKLMQYGKGPLVELVIDPTGDHGFGGDVSNKDRHAIYLSYLIRHWGKF